MPQRKHIRVTCYGPIAVDREYESPWEDIWLRWKDRPGRARKVMITISTVTSLDQQSRLTQDCLDDALRDKNQELIDGFLRDRAYEQGILAKLVGPESIAVADASDDGVVDICLGKSMLNRADAERVLSYWLESAHGVKNVKFDWKRPRFVIVPV